MIMETFVEVLGYGFIALSLLGILYVFIKLLTTGLDALTKHDD
jgi:hypothetical protein